MENWGPEKNWSQPNTLLSWEGKNLTEHHWKLVWIHPAIENEYYRSASRC